MKNKGLVRCITMIFYGTDLGHQCFTTGKRYLKYLKSKGLKGSEEYKLAKECIAQGKHYYRNSDDVYRENQMVLNFIRVIDYKKTDGTIERQYHIADGKVWDEKPVTMEVVVN